MLCLMRSLRIPAPRPLPRLRDESGIALVLALGIMLVLTIALGTTIYLAASAARDAQRTNGGQKAYALGEAGANNAIALLNDNYQAGTTIYPGNPNLLLSTTLTSSVTTLPASTTINVASTAGYNSGSNTISVSASPTSVGSSGAVSCTGITSTSFTGCTGGVAGTYPAGTTVARATAFGANSVTWYGQLVNVPTNLNWKWEWDLTAFGHVKNPTGPTAGDLVRKVTAVVPVVIPASTSVNPATTAIDWIYGTQDVNFSQSVNVASPVYAVRDVTLANTATISETIPASLTLPARPNRLYVGRYLSLTSPQNQVGHVNGTVDAPATPNNDLGEIHVGTACESKANPSPHACVWGPTDKIWGAIEDNTFPLAGFYTPTLTCCSPINWTAPADGTSHPASAGNPSYMGFWYQNAGLGPNSPCATSTGTPPAFDTGDNTINESAYSRSAPFNLTGAAYSCTSADGQTKLAWNPTTNTLTINGTVFIDGSAMSSATAAKYVGKGTIILTGLYSMGNNTALCVNLSGSTCDTTATWDSNTNALAIVADGVDSATGDSIDIKKGNFQGLLLGNGNVNGSVSGTLVIGPMVSVYGSVSDGQSGTLQFPPISFASSGTDGVTGPLPLPQLLSPTQFGGG
jgi:hypothetical protein